MEPLLLVAIFASFFCTFLAVPYLIRRAKQEGLVGKDIHKLDKPEVAEGGGLGLIFGFSIGVLTYIGLETFYFHDSSKITQIFAMLCVILFASIVGIIDDLLGWKKGLSKFIRLLMMLFAAVPLMVISAGNSNVFGVNIGIFYPLLLIPIGVIGATTTYNFLAGYNGLETSQGILILSALSIVTYLTGNKWLSVVVLCMVFALLAFYIFNKYPAQVFPGDILTYAVGAVIACTAILGGVEIIAIFFFIPYILETILKSRGRLKKESFGKLNSDGSLEMPYEKIYGLEHLAIFILKKIKPSKKVYEWEVVWLINGFQILVIGLGFLIFF